MNRTGHKGRVDGNHADIITAIRKAGIGAVSTASVGDGFGDIACGFRGVNVLLEVKKDKSAKLTGPEVKFHETWPGQITVVDTPEMAILAVLDHAKRMGVI